MTYKNGSTGTGGDEYSGLDAFGRVVETLWKKQSDVKQNVTYGYDQASNRNWRRNNLAHDQNGAEKDKHDNFYSYDGLYQVIERQQGNLTVTGSGGNPYNGIGNKQQEEDWCYDETGNWQAYDKESPSNLELTRTHNQANEICSVANPGGVVQPEYDPVGNQTVDIAPGDWTNQYVSLWHTHTWDIEPDNPKQEQFNREEQDYFSQADLDEADDFPKEEDRHIPLRVTFSEFFQAGIRRHDAEWYSPWRKAIAIVVCGPTGEIRVWKPGMSPDANSVPRPGLIIK